MLSTKICIASTCVTVEFPDGLLVLTDAITFAFSHVQYNKVQSGDADCVARYLESGEKAKLMYSSD